MHCKETVQPYYAKNKQSGRKPRTSTYCVTLPAMSKYDYVSCKGNLILL